MMRAWLRCGTSPLLLVVVMMMIRGGNVLCVICFQSEERLWSSCFVSSAVAVFPVDT